MVTTIDELWYGTIHPAKTLGESDEEIKQLENLIQHNYDILREQLEKAAEERLEKYKDVVEEYIQLSNKSAFAEGFSLGVRLVTESVMLGRNKT